VLLFKVADTTALTIDVVAFKVVLNEVFMFDVCLPDKDSTWTILIPLSSSSSLFKNFSSVDLFNGFNVFKVLFRSCLFIRSSNQLCLGRSCAKR